MVKLPSALPPLLFSILLLTVLVSCEPKNQLNIDNLSPEFPQRSPNEEHPQALKHRILKFSAANEEDFDAKANDLGNQIATVLMTRTFEGIWSNPTTTPVVKTFENSTGVAETRIFRVNMLKNILSNGLHFDLHVKDGGASNQSLRIIIEEGGKNFTFDPLLAEIEAVSTVFKVYPYKGETFTDSYKECPGYLKMNFTNAQTGEFLEVDKNDKIPAFGVQFIVKSPTCDIDLSTNVMSMVEGEYGYQHLAAYIVVMSLSAILGILGAQSISSLYANKPEDLRNVSIWSLCLVNAWDFYMFSIHFIGALALSGWLMIVSVLYLILSMRAERKALLAVLFGPSTSFDSDGARQKRTLILYYIGMLMLSIIYMFSYLTSEVGWAFIISGMYLFPQIFHVFQSGKHYKFRCTQVLLFMFSSLSFNLFIRYDPRNIISFPGQSSAFFHVYIGLFIVQVVILLHQREKPRICWKTPFTGEGDKYSLMSGSTFTLGAEDNLDRCLTHKRESNILGC